VAAIVLIRSCPGYRVANASRSCFKSGGTMLNARSARPAATDCTALLICAESLNSRMVMTSGYPSGFASTDHRRKRGLRTSLIVVFVTSEIVYGPVAGTGC
jgi:hypothetical protein